MARVDYRKTGWQSNPNWTVLWCIICSRKDLEQIVFEDVGMEGKVTTWTEMKIQDLVKIEWADALHRFVTCHTLYGDMPPITVEDLKAKLESRSLLSAIRKIYSDMLEFAEGKDDSQ